MNDENTQTSSRYKALKTLGMTEDDVDKKISVIEEWIKENDFPEQMSKIIIEMFLIRNKFRLELVKKKITMYYEIRKQIPEFFEDKHPERTNMKKIMKVSHFLFTPKLTPEFYTVNFFKLIDESHKNFIPRDFCGLSVNVSELKLVQDVYSLGDIYVCDLKGSTFTHLYNFGIGTLRKYTKVIQEAFSTPIKAIHFVNSPGYMKTLIAIIKSILNPKVFNRIYIHEKPEDLVNFISKEILPEEFGGENGTLNEMSEFLQSQFLKFRNRFDELERINEIMMKK